MRKTFLAFALLLAGAASFAQTLTFTAETVTGAGSVVPKLEWSTSPTATSCTASGATDWTGSKSASGTATLAAITASRTYQLVCTWPGDTQAKLTWVAPTENTDGTALAKCASQTVTSGTCLLKYRVNRGTSATALNTPTDVNDRNALTTTITGLTPGTWFFNVMSVNADGTSSSGSSVASKVITATSNVTRSVAITVNPQPNPPTGLTVE